MGFSYDKTQTECRDTPTVAMPTSQSEAPSVDGYHDPLEFLAQSPGGGNQAVGELIPSPGSTPQGGPGDELVQEEQPRWWSGEEQIDGFAPETINQTETWQAADYRDEDGSWIQPSEQDIQAMTDDERHMYEQLQKEYLLEFELRKLEAEMEAWEGGPEEWERIFPDKAQRYYGDR